MPDAAADNVRPDGAALFRLGRPVGAVDAGFAAQQDLLPPDPGARRRRHPNRRAAAGAFARGAV